MEFHLIDKIEILILWNVHFWFLNFRICYIHRLNPLHNISICTSASAKTMIPRFSGLFWAILNIVNSILCQDFCCIAIISIISQRIIIQVFKRMKKTVKCIVNLLSVINFLLTYTVTWKWRVFKIYITTTILSQNSIQN